MKSSKKYTAVAIIANILALFNFIYLSYLHYTTKFGLSEGKSLCNINEKLNCDVVALSKYASLFNIPISNFGASANVISILLLLISYFGLSQENAKILRYSFWLSAFIAVTSIIMGLISSFALGTFCLFCIFAYLISFVQFYAVTKTQHDKNLIQSIPQDVTDLITQFRYVLIFVFSIPLIAWLSNSIVLSSFGLDRLDILIEESIESWKANPTKEFNVNSGIKYMNGDVSKMTIIEFADFLCPHCRLAFRPIHQFIDSRKGVQIIFKPFPLDGTCNPSIENKADGVRCELAYAAICADSLFKKGDEAADYIFEHQSNWNRATLENDLQKLFLVLNLNQTQMKDCMQSSETHDSIRSLAKEGAGIMGTPTFFVNGKELPRAQLIPILDRALKTIE